jgi:hypothetical protein
MIDVSSFSRAVFVENPDINFELISDSFNSDFIKVCARDTGTPQPQQDLSVKGVKINRRNKRIVNKHPKQQDLLTNRFLHETRHDPNCSFGSWRLVHPSKLLILKNGNPTCKSYFKRLANKFAVIVGKDSSDGFTHLREGYVRLLSVLYNKKWLATAGPVASSEDTHQSIAAFFDCLDTKGSITQFGRNWNSSSSLDIKDERKFLLKYFNFLSYIFISYRPINCRIDPVIATFGNKWHNKYFVDAESQGFRDEVRKQFADVGKTIASGIMDGMSDELALKMAAKFVTVEDFFKSIRDKIVWVWEKVCTTVKEACELGMDMLLSAPNYAPEILLTMTTAFIISLFFYCLYELMFAFGRGVKWIWNFAVSFLRTQGHQIPPELAQEMLSHHQAMTLAAEEPSSQAFGVETWGPLLVSSLTAIAFGLNPSTLRVARETVMTINAGTTFVKSLFDGVATLVDKVVFKMLGRHILPSKAIQQQFIDLCKDYWEILDEPQMPLRIASDSQFCVRVLDVRRTAHELAPVIRIAEGLENHDKVTFATMLKDLDRLRQQIFQSGANFMHRPTPVVIFLAGPPCQGKSTVSEILPEMIWQLLAEKYPNDSTFKRNFDLGMVHTRDISSDYWEGYDNHPFLRYNDIFDVKNEDERARQAREIIRIVDDTAAPLNMAFSEKGFKYFNSPFIMITSNNTEFHSLGLTSPNAFMRRLTFPLHVKRSGTFDLTHPETVEEAWEFSVIKAIPRSVLQLGVPQKLLDLKRNECLNLRAIATEIVAKYAEHREAVDLKVSTQVNWCSVFEKMEIDFESVATRSDESISLTPESQGYGFSRLTDPYKELETPEPYDESLDERVEEGESDPLFKILKDKGYDPDNPVTFPVYWDYAQYPHSPLRMLEHTFLKHFNYDLTFLENDTAVSRIALAHRFLPLVRKYGATFLNMVKQPDFVEKPFLAKVVIFYSASLYLNTSLKEVADPYNYKATERGFIVFQDHIVDQVYGDKESFDPKERPFARRLLAFANAAPALKAMINATYSHQLEWDKYFEDMNEYITAKEVWKAYFFRWQTHCKLLNVQAHQSGAWGFVAVGVGFLIGLALQALVLYGFVKLIMYLTGSSEEELSPLSQGTLEYDPYISRKSLKVKDKKNKSKESKWERKATSHGGNQILESLDAPKGLANSIGSISVKFPNQDGVRIINGTWIDSQRFVTASHVFECYGSPEGVYILGDSLSQQASVMIRNNEFVVKLIDISRDLLEIRFTKDLPSRTDLKKFLPSLGYVLPKKVTAFRKRLVKTSNRLTSITLVAEKAEVSKCLVETRFHYRPTSEIDFVTEVSNFVLARDIKSDPGDCGTPYIAKDPSNGYIVAGFHIGMWGADSCFCPVYKDDFPATSQGCVDICIPSFVNKHSEICQEMDAKMIPHGASIALVLDKKKFLPQESCLEASLFQSHYDSRQEASFDDVFPIVAKPAQLGPFYQNGEFFSPLWAQIANLGATTNPALEPRIINKLNKDPLFFTQGFVYTDRPVQKVVRLSLEQAIFGDSSLGIGSIDVSSAGGIYFDLEPEVKKEMFDLERKTFDPKVSVILQEYIDAAERGEQMIHVVNCCLKDELRDLERVALGKTRLFCVGDFFYMLFCKMELGDLVEHLKHFRSGGVSACGTNPYSIEWKMLLLRIFRFGPETKISGGDFSKFDSSLAFLFARLFFLWANTWYKYPTKSKDWYRLRMACYSAIACWYRIGYWVFSTMRGNASGNWMTTLFNSFCNYVAHAMCFYFLRKMNKLHDLCFPECVAMIVYGDDNLNGGRPDISKWWNMINVEFAMDYLFGMLLTTAAKGKVVDPFLKFDEIEFLKRRFRYEGNIVYGPLSLDSITSMLMWVRESEDPKEQLEININVASRELFLHGREVWNLYCTKIKEACLQRGVKWTGGDYDALRHSYLETYSHP